MIMEYDLNLEDACAILGYKKATVYMKVHRGEINYKKYGKFLRFNKEDLENYIENKLK